MIAFIDKYKDHFGVEPICEVLGKARAGGFLSSRGYRAAKSRKPSARTLRHQELAVVIRDIWEHNYRCYGVRKVWIALRRRGWDVGRDQVARIMRRLGLRGKIRGRKVITTRPSRRAEWREDLVQRNFHPDGPCKLWVADITYVKMVGGTHVYTAFVTDCYTRKIVGWAMAQTMTTEALPLQALEAAIGRSKGGCGGLVHHSDHGAQYASLVYSQRLEEAGILASTGAVGDSYDNALAETVNGLYKTELIYEYGPWRTFEQVENATMNWVTWWNSERLHENLGYHTPNEIEDQYNRNRRSGNQQ